MDQIWFLKKSTLFESLRPEDLATLESNAVVRRFDKKQTIYFPGDRGSHVMVLGEGRVKIKSVTPEGKEQILAFIEPGELFGELALVDESPRGEFAEATCPTVVAGLDRARLLEAMGRHPDLSLRITKFIGLKRQVIENRMKSMLFRPFRDRLLYLLAELGERYGKRIGAEIEIGLRLSHQELASLIGATRETVTILLGELQLDRLIRVDRRRIYLVDLKAILKSAGEESFPRLCEPTNGTNWASRTMLT